MCPRPMRFRRVFAEPSFNFFKPAGVALRTLAEVVLTVDELETIRLKDYEGLGQIKSAEIMNISQPTFQRVYNSARKKIADAIINGKAIRIQGGRYCIHSGLEKRKDETNASKVDNCICRVCGFETLHIRGEPCSGRKCPKCGSAMARV